MVDDDIELIEKIKNTTYKYVLNLLDCLPPKHKADIKTIEKDFVPCLCLITTLIEEELVLRYCAKMGADQRSRIYKLMQGKHEGFRKMLSEIELEKQWNPNFPEWVHNYFGEDDDEHKEQPDMPDVQ